MMKTPAVLDQAVHVASRAARHPLSTLAYAAGIVRGAAAVVLRSASGDHAPEAAAPGVPAQRSAQRPAQRPDAPLAAVEPVPAAEQRAPEPPRESFAHEPSPVATHGRPSRRSEATLDDWEADVALDVDPSEDPATGSVVEALARNDRPGDDQVDHGAISATLKEARRGLEAGEP